MFSKSESLLSEGSSIKSESAPKEGESETSLEVLRHWLIFVWTLYINRINEKYSIYFFHKDKYSRNLLLALSWADWSLETGLHPFKKIVVI